MSAESVEENKDSIEARQSLLVALQRRLDILLNQRAQYNARDVPPHILTEIEDLERQIAATKREGRQRGSASAAPAPYLGLNPFKEEHARLFYGRQAEIRQLLAKATNSHFLAVLGPSGSGKSSIVQAGLIPELVRSAGERGQRWYSQTITPASYPLDRLAGALLAVPGSDELHLSLFDLSARLRCEPDLLLRTTNQLLDRANAYLVLVIDQFEELWTQATSVPSRDTQSFVENHQQPFIQQILTTTAVPTSRLLVIVTMRADFFIHVTEHDQLSRLVSDHMVTIAPMTREQLRDAVVKPSDAVGCSYEPGLAEELVRQVYGRPGALPLLQYTLLELWKKRRISDDTMTWAAFKQIGGEIGGVEGVIAAQAEAAFAERPADQDALRTVLVRLVEPSDFENLSTRRRVGLDDLVPIGGSIESLRALIEPFVDKGLLTTEGSGDAGQDGPGVVEITHEALINAWPRFKAWISEARDDLRFQRRFEQAAKEWVAQGEHPDYLWARSLLGRAEEWRRDAQPQLNERERQFLDASHAAEETRVVAERAAAEDRRAARQTRLMVGGAVGTALGYCCGLLYATLSASAGPLLLGRWNVSWFTLVFLSLVLLATGSMVGVCLAAGLGYTSRRHWQALTTTSIGAVAGSIIYLLLALYFLAGQNEALLYLLPGALLGVGLGFGLSAVDVPLRIRAVSWRWQRIGATALGGTLAASAAYATGYFTRDLVSALVSGLILGGFTGAGFAFGGPVAPALGDEEHP